MNTQILIFTAIVAGVTALGIVTWGWVRNRANRLEAETRQRENHNKSLVEAAQMPVSLVNLLEGHRTDIRPAYYSRSALQQLPIRNTGEVKDDSSVRAAE